ncbi:MAG TPA: PKD domain-containing protein [Bacteroidetes bacterium]|nr:PKD domain-containing protein [Bacteroidota bacterium]
MTRRSLLFSFVLLFLGLCLPLQVRAAHIIGGDMTYVCNGNGKYTFTLKLYRDCFSSGALFDSAPGGTLGTVTVYRGSSNTPFPVNGQSTIILDPPVITNVLPNLSNPCLDPPANICVEEGVYVFELDLPVSSESYHIVYQRCCRNGTITNISNPEGTGETFYIELTAAAQGACNDSPVFNDFPPIVICAGEPIDFDHSATDPDGDVLVYELCRPFVGGGPDEMNPQSPGGVAPDPDLPPPYSSVSFVSPFSYSNPMPANPALAIDPNTGLLTGLPGATGQYVVGVCVKEYRNGQLLSTVLRDFQFNVVQCEFNVFADIAEDDVVTLQGVQYYVVNACGINDVMFVNQSTQVSNINNVLWEFDIDGAVESSTQWSPTISFPDTGTYFGRLFLNPGIGAGACTDTAFIEVNVFPGITADFEFGYDTCVAGPVVFTDLSVSGAGPNAIVSWEWSFADGNISDQQHPVHTYNVPGTFPVELTIRDENDCTGQATKVVNYFPVPPLLVVAPSELISCQPARIFFDNLSSPVDEHYDVQWGFGDGGSGTAISPFYTYEEVGTYSVTLSITSPLGCRIDTVWNDLITVLPSPTANFTFSPNQPSNLVPTVSFSDQSMGAVGWKWSFGDIGASIEQNPVFTFPDTGLQAIELVVFHQSGCTDTTVQYLDVIPEIRYFLPNAFTPNGDGFNDGFRGNGMMDGATGFHLSIWNRYGEMLFETTDPFEAWNGRKHNTGQLAPQGVYVVKVVYREPRGRLVELRGVATLVK